MQPSTTARAIVHGMWSSRFADPAVEERFLEWAFARVHKTAVQFNYVTTVLMLIVAGVLVAIGPPLLVPLLTGVFAILAACVVIHVALVRRDLRMALGAAGVSNVFSAFFAALLGHALEPVVGGGFAVAVGVFTCHFVTSTARERPLVALVSGVITISLVGGTRVSRHLEGTLPLSALVAEATLLLSGFAIAIAMTRRADADARVTFTQEEIIRERHTALERERARSEELMQRELAHQVAARSRDLAAFLASSGEGEGLRRLEGVKGQIADRYRVLGTLGAGAMGEVYEVERLTDGGRFALKLVSGEVTGRGAARFARKAEFEASVRHENLVSIVDVGVSHGVPYLVMELVPGGTLERQRARFGDVRWALPILSQLAAGLAALHAAGVVHRDLKPANVLLAGDDERPRVKVSDYGIASLRDAEPARASVDPQAETLTKQLPSDRSPALTGTGVMLGTPLYMAPESVRGGRELDAAADVFAFGIVAYEMLAGRMPFSAPSVMLVTATGELPVPAPLGPEVPTEVARAIASALDPVRTKRPSAAALRAALEAA